MLLSASLAALVLLCATAAAVPAAVPGDAPFTKEQILEGLLQRPTLLPVHSFKILEALAKPALSKRQTSGFDMGSVLNQVMGNTLKADPPAPLVPDESLGKSVEWAAVGAKRKKIRYGPYRIPAISEKNLESEYLNVQGVINTIGLAIKKPCEGECTLLSMEGDLEFADGRKASNADGAWFHHAVLLNTGPRIIDATCGSAPFDTMFMSGNERTVNGYGLPDSSIKSGYRITPSDSFVLSTELMNLKDEAQWVWLTITYEMIDGYREDFRNGRVLWMTIGNPILVCPGAKWTNPWGATNLTKSGQPKSAAFSEKSFPWTAPRDAHILGMGAHMHDGGINLEVFQNGKVVCESTPEYGRSNTGHNMGGMKNRRQISGGAASNVEIEHIEKQESCKFRDGKPLKKGDTLYVQANYDFKRHPGMKNKKGELDEVMGIVGAVVAF